MVAFFLPILTVILALPFFNMVALPAASILTSLPGLADQMGTAEPALAGLAVAL